MRKSQISVPLVFGIVLIVLVTILLIKQGIDQRRSLEDEAQKIKSFNSIRERVETYVTDCISSKNMEVFDMLWVTSLEDIKIYLRRHFFECIDDFSNFREEGYDFGYFNHTETLSLDGNKATILMNFTVNITRDSQRTQIKEFRSVIDLDDLNLTTKGPYIVNFKDVKDYEMPFKNIAYKKEDYDGLKLYIVKVNLNDPTLQFLVTPRQNYLEGTSAFLEKHNLQLAINGGGWDWAKPLNTDTELITYSQGTLVSQGPDFWVSVTITKNNSIILAKKPKEDDLYNVVTGFNLIVTDSEVNPRMFPGGPGYKVGYETMDPRTTIGFDEDKNILNIILVDSGMVGVRSGLKHRDIGAIHVREGSDTAINMDGGGSTTLVIEGQGIVNAPSDGHERPVATHLGIWAQKLDFHEENAEMPINLEVPDIGNEARNGPAEIPNFRIVGEGIAAGGQPSEAGLKNLAELGYKTIIDVSGAEVGWEQNVAQGLGMNYVYSPLGIYGSAEKINAPANSVADMLANPAYQPVYVHCQYGVHRTGVSIGVYRVKYLGWTFEQAKAEMQQYSYGFWPEEYNYLFDAVQMNS